MPLSHPKDVTTQSNRVRRKVLKSFQNLFTLLVGVVRMLLEGSMDVPTTSKIPKMSVKKQRPNILKKILTQLTIPSPTPLQTKYCALFSDVAMK